MKRFLSNIIVIYFLIGIYSCEKDQVDNELLAYVTKNLAGYESVPVNGTDYVVVNMGNIQASNKRAQFQVMLEDSLSQDVAVEAKIVPDANWIKTFDQIYNLNSPELAGDLFEIEESEIIIKAGELASSDKIKLRLNNISKLSEGKFKFVIPIQMKVKTPGAKLKSELMFVRYNVDATNLKLSIEGAPSIKDVQAVFTPGYKNADIPYRVLLNQRYGLPVSVFVDQGQNVDLVTRYNQEHDTDYLPFPIGSYKILGAATINPYQLLNTTGIKVQFPDNSFFSTDRSYLLPVRVSSSEPKEVLAIESESISYVFLKLNNIEVGSSHELEGNVIDRSNWLVKRGSSNINGAIENIIDGKNTTHWVTYAVKGDGWFSLDIAKETSIKGFKVTPADVSSLKLNPLQTEVFSSDDGVSWHLEGVYYGSATQAGSGVESPNIEVYKFITPVTARYFKFIFRTSQAAPFAGLAEINAIQ
ncbi:BT_3987 domain-containing protein [Sphingobacterium sp. xlx-130]|uniref:BT_3987 domain-containing protein n=1 Tax=Sphingobacterium sp. xlx-130 TaxID=2654323 RepID=UPI0013DD5AC9|nr:DUF1735 domain-containing protein [Sphingobacterium sp. xlx-130]